MNIKQRKLGHSQNSKPIEFHVGNPQNCNNPHRSQLQSDCLQILDANTKDHHYLEKFGNTLNNPQLSKYPDCSKYKVYLCDYEYQGRMYGVDIYALSWEDARARLKAITQNGEIIGEECLRISVPFKESWMHKIMKWLGY